MKKLREYLNSFCKILIFTILVTSLFSPKADAKGKHELVIRFENFKEITKTVDGTVLDELVFDIWKLNDDFPLVDTRDKIKEFNSLSNEKLDEKFGKGFEKKAPIKDDTVRLSNMEEGIYFIRERASKNRLEYLSPIIIKISGDEPKIEIFGKPTEETPGEPNGGIDIEKLSDTGKKLEAVEFKLYSVKNGQKTQTPLKLFDGIYTYSKQGTGLTLITDRNGLIKIRNLPYGKYILEETKTLEGYIIQNKSMEINISDISVVRKTVVNKEDTPKGGRKFLKISDDKNKSPLKGAKFGVYQYINKKYVPVKQDGKNLILISASNGEFEVKDLPYGKYYLKELEAPDGYYKLEGYLEFEVNGETYYKTILIIKNKKKPPLAPPETPPETPPLAPPSKPPSNTPNTGDLGYKKYLIVALGAVALLILIRRKKDEE